MRTVNVCECDYELYELAVREGWYEGDREDFDTLSLFEGDPDMIRVDGQVGYFFHYADNDTVYYWFDEWRGLHNIGAILTRFFEHRLGKEYTEDVQSWHWFDHHNGIAYRGGMGYVYSIYPLRIAA